MIVECWWYLFPIAVTTPFTRERIHTERILEERWIVDDPDTLTSVVDKMFSERKHA